MMGVATYKIPSMKMELIVNLRVVASWSFQSDGSGRARMPTSTMTLRILMATK